MKTNKTVYICSTAFNWDLDPSNIKGVKVYPSEEALREHCKCVDTTNPNGYPCQVLKATLSIDHDEQ